MNSDNKRKIEFSKGEGKDELRRKFLKQALGALGFGVFAPAAAGMLKSCEYDFEKPLISEGYSIEVDVTQYEKLMQTGSGIVQRFGNANHGIPLIIVKIDDAEFACFSSLCTHDYCFGDDLWVQSRRFTIICECHGSKFDARNGGKPFEGPAERPLRKFPSSFNPDTNILTIEF